ncbi:MAG: Cna B-type domain-containing protein [Blautia faecis]
MTNTYAPEETSVSVRKVWDDSSNQDGIRPASVTVQLYADGTASGAPVDLNAANNWSHTLDRTCEESKQDRTLNIRWTK